MEPCSSALYSYLLDDLYGDSPKRSFVTNESYASDYWPGASVTDVTKLRLVRSLFKKLNDAIEPDAESKCLEKFLAANNRCREWQLELLNTKEEELFGLVKRELDLFFHPGGECLVSSLYDLMDHGRLGPGASLGATGVDFYAKLFSSQLSATSSEVYDLYADYINWYSTWRNAELNRFITCGGPKYSSESKLTYVRKTRDISRSICTEPSLNMFLQLGFGRILEARLGGYYNIFLGVQPDKNRDLAKRGSIDGSISTIDLESASDSMSLRLCEEIFPRWVFEILLMLRCNATYDSKSRTRVPLYMVSSMGNGFTFPLQTIVFSAVVRAVQTFHSAYKSPWGVFGDDIICESNLYTDVCRLLNILGFRVNASKSYSVGPFRESCGADFYLGTNVRGVYIKTLKTMQARYVAINLLTEWSTRTGIPLSRTIGYLQDSVRFLAIPPWAPVDSGIRVPESVIRGLGFYKARKQRYLFRHYVPYMPKITFDDTGRGLNGGRLKQALRRKGNPDGLLFSAAGGYIESTGVPVALKQGESPQYRTRWSVSPFWGPAIDQIRLQGSDFWERWNTVASELITLSS